MCTTALLVGTVVPPRTLDLYFPQVRTPHTGCPTIMDGMDAGSHRGILIVDGLYSPSSVRQINLPLGSYATITTPLHSVPSLGPVPRTHSSKETPVGSESG